MCIHIFALHKNISNLTFSLDYKDDLTPLILEELNKN